MTWLTGCRVPREDAEVLRRRLITLGILSPDHEPRREGGRVIFPLSRDGEGLGLDLVKVDFEERILRPASYTQGVGIDERLKKDLPKSFDVIGEIVLVRLPESLLAHRKEVGRALLEFVPHARVVALDSGVMGKARVRNLEVIAGAGPMVTDYRENRLTFKVDLERVYFSPRLAREHDIVARGSADGERVLDLFSGMGAFSLTILSRHHRSTAVAVDSNPSAIALVRENAVRLGLEKRLVPLLEDADDFLRGKETFDRVVMNLPREGYKYLRPVGAVVKSCGSLHFYGLFRREDALLAGAKVLSALEGDDNRPRWTLEGSRIVHPYSPSTLLMAFTVKKDGEG